MNSRGGGAVWGHWADLSRVSRGRPVPYLGVPSTSLASHKTARDPSMEPRGVGLVIF